MKVFTHLLVAIVLFVTVPQSPETPVSQAGEFQQLTLTISTSKEKYAEFEPIPLTLKLKNETDKPLTGHKVLNFGTGYVQLYVDRGEGEEKVRSVTPLIIDVYVKPNVFNPGDEVKNTEYLSFKLNELFPHPGTYRLRVELRAVKSNETLSSKPIAVEIGEPQGIDAAALAFLRTQMNPAYLFTGMTVAGNPEQQQRLELFVSQYGDSVYGDSATLVLAQIRLAHGEFEQARVLFERLAKPDSQYAGEAARALRVIAQKTQR